MPQIVRVFIKAALVNLVLALAVGLISVAGPLFHISLPGTLPVYFHLLMVGWVTQLIIGVAYWMFPRYSKEEPRGPERAAWIILILLNAGLALRAVGEPLLSSDVRAIAGMLLAVSAALQLAAGWLFIAMVWPRVRER